MEQELELEEVKEVEVMLYVKWYGHTPSVYAVGDSGFVPEHDVAYRVRIPKRHYRLEG